MDRFSAGAGRDRIFARDGSRERVDCGTDRGDRAAVDRLDGPRGCEQLIRTIRASLSVGRIDPNLDLPSFEPRIDCPTTAADKCGGQILLFDARGRRVARARWYHTSEVSVELAPRIARAVRRGDVVSLRAVVTVADRAGRGSTLRQRVVLRRKG